jgi:hypothetical protein
MVKEAKRLDVGLAINQVHAVEAFVENICDTYNINNAYFGHILFTVTELFCLAARKGNDEKQKVRIAFTSDKSGLKFLFSFGDNFLDMAAGFSVTEEELLDNPQLEEFDQGFLAIRMLCDDIQLHAEGASIELIFYVSSINKSLTMKRIKALDMYYAGILLPNEV